MYDTAHTIWSAARDVILFLYHVQKIFVYSYIHRTSVVQNIIMIYIEFACTKCSHRVGIKYKMPRALQANIYIFMDEM